MELRSASGLFPVHHRQAGHRGAEPGDPVAAQGADAEAIIARCIGDIPGGHSIFYQKHMTLHLLPQLDRSWLAALDNCFLIREPEAVVASYAEVRDDRYVEKLVPYDLLRPATEAITQNGNGNTSQSNWQPSPRTVDAPRS